jgi:uncharacterized membrane protein
MKRSLVLPTTALIVAWLFFIAFLFATLDRLPPQVATHFDAAGVPNDGMTRKGHALFLVGMGTGLPLFLIATFAWVRALGGKGCNIPHRSYWLAPERRQAAMDFILAWGLWLAVVMVVFMGALHWLILRANASQPPQLASGDLLLVVAGFLAAVIAWIVVLFVRFGRPK